MKILMLGWELPPHNSGGLGVACYQLCKALSRKGADISFVLPYTADHAADFMTIHAAHPQDVLSVQKSGIAYDSYKYVKTDGSVEWADIYTQARIFEQSIDRLVGEQTFDVIHAHDWLTFRAGLRARELSGKPLILHVHSIERDRAGGSSGNPLVAEIEQEAMLLADRVIAVSAHTKQLIVDTYAIPSDKIEVVHNSMDLGDVAPLDPQNAYHYLSAMKQTGYKVVVNVGRLTIQKGLTNLLYAAAEVVRREPKTIFLLVGSGEQLHELLELAAQLGISRNVLFAGFQRGKQWRDAYAIGDLFVMPSRSEPFGLTPLEAIGYGTPALISRQSGVAEVLQNCLKVDYWDVNELANQMVAALRSEPLRSELLANARMEYDRLSWSPAADKLYDLYSHHVSANREMVAA